MVYTFLISKQCYLKVLYIFCGQLFLSIVWGSHYQLAGSIIRLYLAVTELFSISLASHINGRE